VQEHADGAVDAGCGVPHQQLQHADVMPLTGARAVLIFEGCSQSPE
jgi:hypothetical protein